MSERCPRCDSPAQHLHPAVQWEGEVQPCPDPFHFQETNQNTSGEATAQEPMTLTDYAAIAADPGILQTVATLRARVAELEQQQTSQCAERDLLWCRALLALPIEQVEQTVRVFNELRPDQGKLAPPPARSAGAAMKKRRTKKTQPERRQKARSIHVIGPRTSMRDKALARADLVSFFTKRF